MCDNKRKVLTIMGAIIHNEKKNIFNRFLQRHNEKEKENDEKM